MSSGATDRALIGPCEGSCGVDGRGRIQPLRNVGGRYLCRECALAALEEEVEA